VPVGLILKVIRAQFMDPPALRNETVFSLFLKCSAFRKPQGTTDNFVGNGFDCSGICAVLCHCYQLLFVRAGTFRLCCDVTDTNPSQV